MEDEEQAKPSVLETTNWINEHKYAAIRMPTHLVEMPPEDVAARLQDVGHVETVMNSMIKLQDFTKYVSVAFIWPDNKPLPPHDEGKVSTLDAACDSGFPAGSIRRSPGPMGYLRSSPRDSLDEVHEEIQGKR